jgi:hypothetical protein
LRQERQPSQLPVNCRSIAGQLPDRCRVLILFRRRIQAYDYVLLRQERVAPLYTAFGSSRRHDEGGNMSEIQQVEESQVEIDATEEPVTDESATEAPEPSIRVMCCDQAA